MDVWQPLAAKHIFSIPSEVGYRRIFFGTQKMESVGENEVTTGGVTDKNRRFRVTVRLREAEYRTLQKRAGDTASGEMADYIRQVLTHKKIEHFYRNRSMDDWIDELSKMRRELSALGNNFNQIVKKINSTGGKQEFAFWLREATAMQGELLQRVAAVQGKIDQFAAQWFANSSPETPSAALSATTKTK